MKTKLIGLIASVALMGSGAALAGGDGKKYDKPQSTQSQDSTGGSGQAGTPSHMNQGSTQQLGPNELIGRVVKSDKKMVWVEHAGAIVPLKIDKQTQFGDTNIKRAQDFREGDQIRASFEVRKTDNVATSIQKSDSNLGGSGSMGSDTGGSGSDLGTPIDQNTLPPSPIHDSTGGSGTGSDLNPPDVSDEGTSSDLGSDTSKGTGDY